MVLLAKRSAETMLLLAEHITIALKRSGNDVLAKHTAGTVALSTKHTAGTIVLWARHSVGTTLFSVGTTLLLAEHPVGTMALKFAGWQNTQREQWFCWRIERGRQGIR